MEFSLKERHRIYKLGFKRYKKYIKQNPTYSYLGMCNTFAMAIAERHEMYRHNYHDMIMANDMLEALPEFFALKPEHIDISTVRIRLFWWPRDDTDTRIKNYELLIKQTRSGFNRFIYCLYDKLLKK